MRSALLLFVGLMAIPVLPPPPPVPFRAPAAVRAARVADPAHERCVKRSTVARAPSAVREARARA